MRVESTRPYGLPVQTKETTENAPNRTQRGPERTTNASGDHFELSPEQLVTQSLLAADLGNSVGETLPSERLAEIRGKISTGYYLTPQAAEETAESITSFHRSIRK